MNEYSSPSYTRDSDDAGTTPAVPGSSTYITMASLDEANIVQSEDILRIVKLTEAEYDALVVADAVEELTLYMVTE